MKNTFQYLLSIIFIHEVIQFIMKVRSHQVAYDTDTQICYIIIFKQNLMPKVPYLYYSLLVVLFILSVYSLNTLNVCFSYLVKSIKKSYFFLILAHILTFKSISENFSFYYMLKNILTILPTLLVYIRAIRIFFFFVFFIQF